jgi:hypothetical protein
VGLTELLARAAVRRPHVLLVPVPGHRPLRWAAEDALDGLGWRRAASPAEADVLLCCGAPGKELAEHVEVAWDGMPGPRVRREVSTVTEIEPALRAAALELADVAAQRQDARSRPAPRLSSADEGADLNDDTDMSGGAMDHGMDHDMGMSDGGMDHDMDMSGGEMNHDMDMSEAGMDHDMDMSGGDMAGMDHSMHMDMGMELPGGLVMADRVEDRDGLRLEGLNLSLGPLLPHWPAGLRLDVVLSGDVLVSAKVVRLDPQAEPPAPESLLALDALALLLDASGWSDGAVRARRARREGGSGPAIDDLLRRLRRARLLRWSLRGLPAPGSGDLVTHLDRLVAVAREESALPSADDAQLASDVVGLDVGTAALVVAAHAPLLPVAAHV